MQDTKSSVPVQTYWSTKAKHSLSFKYKWLKHTRQSPRLQFFNTYYWGLEPSICSAFL